MGEFRSKCTSGDTLTLDTAISAGKFLCSEGKQGVVPVSYTLTIQDLAIICKTR